MRSEIDYEVVFRTGPALSAVLTPTLVIVAVNDAFLEVSGHRREDLLGRDLFDVFPPNPAAPEDSEQQGAQMLRTSLEQVMTTRRRDFMPLQRYDVEMADRPGVFEERYWSTVNTPVLGSHGEVRCILLICEEVTDFVRALRRSGAACEQDSLALQLQTLNDQLRRAHREQCETTSALSEAIERQRRLVQDASHDLRNPIAGLLTELQVALSDPGIDLQTILRKLVRDAERLNDIVTDLLALARVNSETRESERLIELAVFVGEELDRRTPGTPVLSRLDPHVCVRASVIRLARLLGNLLTNAERHAHTKIEVVVTADPPDAVLEVLDDGLGIPPEDRERVFERRYRREEARVRDPGGSGLGLSIAREIAQEHGGRLYAAEHHGGARFVLRLPLATERYRSNPTAGDGACRPI
ncbi:PAS domain-containing sensor histidine kinase [Microbispora bryophytorum]|nr:PAS domain-containing sensor histidine kinase [Microbispora bryophytorum]MBD3137395.1 PAS domain-containing sensor histidine kinase [Microbispora bryophytorum]TQS06835.1 PAS domain-containing protein [Microbispora bryophytorum]